MKFTESLKKNFQFRYVYNRGKSIANRHFVMYAVKNGTQGNRLGISVSKKVGKSVVRSHVTRLVKESYRNMEEDLKRGYDLVVIARIASANATYHEVYASLRHLFKKHQFILTQQEKENMKFAQKKTETS